MLDGTFGAGGYHLGYSEGRCGCNCARPRSDCDCGQGRRWLLLMQAIFLSFIRSFRSLPTHAPHNGLDGVVLDIGVSSMQLDEAERGFSFNKSGPLDRRMSASGVSAADVVNCAKLADLIRIFASR